MTNMENLENHLNEHERQRLVNEAALKQLQQDETRRVARGYAVMAAVVGYGEGAMGGGTFGKVSHFAKLFCIGFALLAPSLLVWRVLL
ncbi:hypothetical protein [Roseobacter denitrificans]|uniref:Uncharacterized protein n=1 Tax=Roseobacter denitrificans (strain ATCC 33942 / OCh 114) TaxID=375451 RepID=Q16AW4_ROSDO|nr:hypothetical protein [Roseobacter denitrificans]ABG30879.1 hypothetical protein RD1_1231 [Roseobacter denitrificans OCh 114]SFG14784.1 hypothetical protein SAMN05443635_108159 [Roseobacter denitrificans OCh 114]